MEIICEEKINNTIIFEDDFNFKFFSKKSFKHLDQYFKDELIFRSKGTCSNKNWFSYDCKQKILFKILSSK